MADKLQIADRREINGLIPVEELDVSLEALLDSGPLDQAVRRPKSVVKRAKFSDTKDWDVVKARPSNFAVAAKTLMRATRIFRPCETCVARFV